MRSKDWKWLILAPFMVTLLTACPERHHHDQTDHSPFSGLWLNEKAYRDYSQARGDMRLFCQRVQQNPALHGCSRDTWTGLPRIQAWQVDGDGDVFEWAPNVRVNELAFRDNYYIGHVRDDGYFVKQTYAEAHSAGFYGGYGPRASWTAEASLSLDTANRLVVYRAAYDRPGMGRTYTRMSEGDLRRYVGMVADCADAMYPAGARGGVQGVQPRAAAPGDYDGGVGSDNGSVVVVPPQPEHRR